jgi:hypothetical protein
MAIFLEPYVRQSNGGTIILIDFSKMALKNLQNSVADIIITALDLVPFEALLFNWIRNL